MSESPDALEVRLVERQAIRAGPAFGPGAAYSSASVATWKSLAETSAPGMKYEYPATRL